MSLAEKTIIADFLFTGSLAAGTLYQPAAADGGGDLGADEVAEIDEVEITSPISGGTPQDLDSVYLVIDGQSTQNVLNMSGRDDISTNPIRRQTLINDPKTDFHYFGEDIVTALSRPLPQLANTTLKASSRVTIIAKAGSSTVNEPFRVRIKGYKYTKRMLDNLPTRTFPGNFTIRDTRNQRDINVPLQSLAINIENWSLLPGGPDQQVPKINPFLRFATNSSPTTINTRYEFRFDLGNVDDEFKDMSFPLDIQNKIFIPTGLGARAHTNSKAVWLRDTGDNFYDRTPPGGFSVLENRNEIIFGRGTPQLPSDIPLYYPIPQYGVTDHILYRTSAVVSMIDNGNSVPADGVAVALTGKVIDLGGKI